MKRVVTQAIICFVLISMWLYVVVYAYLSFEAGLFSCFEDLYGKWWVLVGLTLGIIAILSPLYLRIIVKDKIYRTLLSIMICACFILTAIFSYNYTISKFKDFTVEKWRKYPNQRMWMIDDLKENHGVIGMNKDDVLLFLGKPDRMTENSYTYEYDYGHIDVVFFECCASLISLTDYY